MTDIFREVEEEIRRERVEELWKKYGDYVIAIAALMVIAAAGFQLWRVYEQRQQAKASATYMAATELLNAGSASEAAQAFAKLATTAPGGYASIALLQKANALYAAGDVPEAVETYKEIAAKGDPLLGAVARVRAGWANVETAPRGDLAILLQPLLDTATAWHPMAREILAYSDYHSGATAKALEEYRDIVNDRQAPEYLRRRCDAMATYLAAGGDSNYGTVPLPEPAKTPPQNTSAASDQGAKQK